MLGNEEKALSHVAGVKRKKAVPRADLLPVLSSPAGVVSAVAPAMLRSGPAGPSGGTGTSSSSETTCLIANSLTMARLAVLKILRQNADAEAV
jgi:hypothetical protein